MKKNSFNKYWQYIIDDEKLITYYVAPRSTKLSKKKQYYSFGNDLNTDYIYLTEDPNTVEHFFDDLHPIGKDDALIVLSNDRKKINNIIKKGEYLANLSNPYYGYHSYKVIIRGKTFYLEVHELDNQYYEEIRKNPTFQALELVDSLLFEKNIDFESMNVEAKLYNNIIDAEYYYQKNVLSKLK